VTGIDLTLPMLELAAEKAGARRVRWVAGDMLALPVATASVDLVTAGYGLRNVPVLSAGLAEIARVLKRGGVHVFTIPHDPHQPHTIERARVEQGTIIHERPAVYHGDSIRGQGILAFRDFGADAAERISRPKAVCREVFVGLPDARAASVFIARKSS
jgi:SAM-dependent methyltransferase